MRKSTKLIGAVSVAAVVAAGGSAFTATGLLNSAGASQYIGGTVSQSVSGATLNSVTYSFGDAPANTAVHSVALVFGDASTDGLTPTVALTGGNAVVFTCDAIAVTTHLSTCTTAGADKVGVTSIAVTV
jgi:hypothetical protein